MNGCRSDPAEESRRIGETIAQRPGGENGTTQAEGSFPAQPLALTRVAILKPVVALLERAGAPVGRLLESVGLAASVIDQDEGLIPTSLVVRFVGSAAVATGTPDLGFRAGEEAMLEDLGTFGRVIRHAGTLGDALATLERCGGAFSSGDRYWLARQGDQRRLCHAFHIEPPRGFRQADQYAMMLGLNLIRLVSPRSWTPAAVEMQSGPWSGSQRISSLRGVPVTFGERVTAVTFPAALLAARLPPAPGGSEVPDREVDAWASSGPAGDFATSVRQVVDTVSGDLCPKIELIARVVDMSVRTLQRRLALCGEPYHRIVEHANFAGAADLLLRSNDKITAIALDMGYSDTAHFTRAFRRWSGCSPREFRHRAASWELADRTSRTRLSSG